MNRNPILATSPWSTRIAGLAAAVLTSAALLGALGQSLNPERIGDGAPLVQLEPVTITAIAPVRPTPVAAIDGATRSN